MVPENRAEKLIIDTNVQEFFKGLVTKAAANQKMTTTEGTLYYIVNLLVSFTHSDDFFEQTPAGLELKPLAFIYADAVEASSVDERNKALKRLGDVALFICGVFPHSLSRKLVDVDYYIAMGGNAYGHLSDVVKDAFRWRMFRDIFDELSVNFTAFVDILGEVSERAHFSRDTDIMRLYEIWLRTGSRRTARQLAKLGIQPAAGSISQRHH
jgi:hypothetical protein